MIITNFVLLNVLHKLEISIEIQSYEWTMGDILVLRHVMEAPSAKLFTAYILRK